MSLCDLAVAADHARFGLPEVEGRRVPDAGARLPARYASARATLNELCLTGELIDAARALEIGLLNDVVPGAELDARVEALLTRVRAASPVATATRQVRDRRDGVAGVRARRWPSPRRRSRSLSRTGDAREGLAAFNEKRKPRWTTEGGDGS